jgi:hypothetical protein
MKKLLLLIMVGYYFVTANAQSCLPNGINFVRQTQIDSFPFNYPGCKTISGAIRISEETPGNITNLDSLIQIDSIQSDLIITNNSALTSLKGFDSLRMIRHKLEISYNPSLNSIKALSLLYRTGRSLTILNCPSLTSLEGLGNLRNLNGLVLEAIGIKNLSGLDLIQKIEGSFNVINCPDLETLEGIGRPVNKTETVNIAFCPKIMNLKGLDVLRSISGTVNINNCNALTSLEGLTASNFYNLYISTNPNLISLNGLPPGIDTLDVLNINFNHKLTNLKGLESLKAVTGELLISSNQGLITLEGLENLSYIYWAIFSDNQALTSFSGLNSYATGSFLSIVNSHGLANVKELSSLTSLISLSISNNKILSSLIGLQFLDPNILREVNIYDNPKLSACHVKSICDFLAVPDNPAMVMNNLTDCDTRPAILAACATPLPVLLTELHAQPQGQSVKLSWKTLTEINSKAFEIQRSANATQWQDIGLVKAAGNSSSAVNYSFIDAKPSNGVIYYRLKIVDLDGRLAYSNVVNTRITGSGVLTLSPNPATQFVEINGLEKAQVKVLDANGRVLINQAVNGNTNVNISGLSKGLYFFEVSSEHTRTVKKIIKQ